MKYSVNLILGARSEPRISELIKKLQVGQIRKCHVSYTDNFESEHAINLHIQHRNARITTLGKAQIIEQRKYKKSGEVYKQITYKVVSLKKR